MLQLSSGFLKSKCKSNIRKESYGNTDIELHIVRRKCYCQEVVYVHLHTPLPFLGLFDSEEGGTTILRNIGNYVPLDMA
jgi:hypothetical protein